VVVAIGIDHYAAWPRLHNAVNDARGAARMFRELGFVEVTGPLLDGAATGEAMRRLVNIDLAELSPDDDLVVFFAGHGHTDVATYDDVSVKTGYIIPADSAAPDGRDGATWLRLDGWLSDIARLPPKHILVIIDACNSGVALSALHKWRDGAAALTDDLDALRARRSRCVITSALDDQRAMDGGPRPGHSLFTGCLIEGLSGGLADGGQRVATGREIGQYLQKRVRSYPHTTQTPDFGAFELDDRGDIVVPILRTGATGPRPRLSSTESGFAGERLRPASTRTWRRWLLAGVGAAVAIGAGLLIHGPSAGDGARGAAEVALAPAPGPIEIPAIEIRGSVVEPGVLRQPWVPAIALPFDALSDDVLGKERDLARRSRDPAQRRVHTIVVAAVLYQKASIAGDTAARLRTEQKAWLSEARDLLRGVLTKPGQASEEAAWRLRGVCELLLADYPAAERTWRTLVEHYPGSPDEPSHRAWLAYTLLRQDRTQDAIAVTASEERDGRHPELAYMAAWARWHTGDRAGAWRQIAVAAERWMEAGWPCSGGRHECLLQLDSAAGGLGRELCFLAARASSSLDEGLSAAAAYLPNVSSLADREQRYDILRFLGWSYRTAGRWSDASATYDKALAFMGDRARVSDVIAIRAAQAELAVRLDRPDAAEAYATQAIDGVGRCDTDEPAMTPSDRTTTCAKAKLEAVQRLYAIAELLGKLRGTWDDQRYDQLAHELHVMTISSLGNDATRAKAQKVAAELEASLAHPGVTAAVDRTALRDLLALHNEEATACYDAGLVAHPALAGSVALVLEVDRRGAVQRAIARPVEGSADLTTVAGCIADRARGWKLPILGTGARIELHYALSVISGN
jgi:tetratricopeptide (TPR) repeat protein